MMKTRAKATRAALLAAVALAAGGASAAGCHPGVDVDVTVYTAGAFDIFGAADKVRVTAIGTDAETGAREILKSREYGANSGHATLGLIPFSEGMQIRVETLDTSGNVTGYGASLLHDILKDTPSDDIPVSVFVFVTPIKTVVPALRASDQLPTTMPAGRVGMATAVLPDGRILVTGGAVMATDTLGHIDPSTIARYAEVFDAESGRFVSIADTMAMLNPLNAPRAFHTATLLPDNGVLIAGGLTQQMGMLSTLTSGEVFEFDSCSFPSPDAIVQTALCAFIPVPTLMSDARAHHTATLRDDGSVLIAGGTFEQVVMPGSFDVTFLNTTELYTRANGFAAAATMSDERAYHTATLLPSGDVLVTGGIGADGVGNPEVLASAEIYTGTGWTGIGAMSTPRAYHTANLATYADGTQVVLVAGGYTTASFDPMGRTLFSAPSALVETYDPAVGFNPMLARVIPGMVQIAEHTGTTLPSGKVALLGGKTGGGLPSVFAITLDPSPMGPGFLSDPSGVLSTPRATHGAELLPGGQVLIFGGFNASGGTPIVYNTAEVYTPPL
jgi:hypothetical protein